MKIVLKNLKRKIALSILLILILVLIGYGVVFVKGFFNTEKGMTRKYLNEIDDIIETSEAKKVIKIVKVDTNADGVEDYFALLGEPKYEEVDTSKVEIFKSINSNLEMYNNISIHYVDGANKKDISYDTKKTYTLNVDLNYIIHNDKVYVRVSDTSGNIALLYLEKEELKNVITNTLSSDDLVGYTIEGKFKEEDGVKLEVKLDNYGKNYLKSIKDVYTLDYTNTNVNSNNYRLTYMANKFSRFDFEQTEDKSALYLVCTQYVLYSNENSELNKNEGFIVTKFNVTKENKLAFNSVTVDK